ncbi:MAG: hypothetical protein M3286_05290, partial [Thermoproteota archaeon]|nr:hypothetical protein [Thermoproteota archaeon]
AHKTEFAEKGWVGLFLVKDPTETQSDSNSSSSSSSSTISTNALLETKANSKAISGGGVGS